MKKEKSALRQIIVIGVFLIIGAFLLSVYISKNNPFERMASNMVNNRYEVRTKEIKNGQGKNNELIRVSFPREGEKIGGTIYVTGIAKGAWYFEGSFPVYLVDSSGKKLASTSASAQGGWMRKDFVPFSATLKYPVDRVTPAKLILQKDNPSGLRERDDSIEIPMTLEPKKTTAEVFFSSRYHDPNVSSCEQVFPVARPAFETMALTRQTLEELFEGPTEKERELGYTNNIPPNVKIQKLDTTTGVARVDLSREFLELDVDVACRRLLMQKQVEETIKNVSGAQKVIITVDGQAFPGEFPDEGPKMR